VVEDDLLAQGREPARPSLTAHAVLGLLGAPGVAVLVMAVAVLAAGAASTWRLDPARGGGPAGERVPGVGAGTAEPLRPLPRVILNQASVAAGREVPDGVLRLRIQVEGVPGAQLLSLRVELPGSAVVLAPLPDALSPRGTAQLRLEVLPRCPDAARGLSRAALVAAVRAREGAGVRRVRVRLDTAGFLADAVAARCGPVDGVAALVPPLAQLAEPAGQGLLRTQAALAAAGPAPVNVLAVRPGPGLRVAVRTPLPLVLQPGALPLPLAVDLRPDGCGGAPDTPPYVLVLATGETVAASVEQRLRRQLDLLRPYRCTAP
jgi:hypothetical protein